MKKYNDYTEAILRYLRRLNELKAYYANLQDDIGIKQQMLSTISTPITANYSLAPGSGGTNISKVETECERREKIQSELSNLQIDAAALQSKLSKIDRALAALDEDSRKVIKMRWIDGRKWEYIAITLHCSPKNCRDKSAAALEKIALMVFGPVAMPEQLSFVFFDSKVVCG